MMSEKHDGEVIEVDPDEALVKQVRPDTLLVGVNHGVDIATLPTPPTRFKTSVQTADQLILESPQSTHEKASELQRAVAPLDYEGFAFSNFLERNKSEEVRGRTFFRRR